MAPSKNDPSRSETNTVPQEPLPPQPHPSFIQVAKPYVFERTIQQCFAATGVDRLREDGIRIQGVTWIENVRKALRLPVRTFNTACVYFHKFRLVHSDNEYNYMDASASALFTACKIEDTLKKSREILCAAYNLKLSPADQLAPDDPVFDNPSRGIIGLERLMLEASGFDFRSRHPQKLLVKLAKLNGVKEGDEVAQVAYYTTLDLYRTFAPLKQTTATLAFASLELASRLLATGLERVEKGEDYEQWKTSRAEVMETLLDLLELYTHHRSSTVLGPRFPLEAFLTIRIPLNREAEDKHLPRFTNWQEDTTLPPKVNGTKPGKHAIHKERPQDREKNAAKDMPPANPLTPISATGEKSLAGGDRAREGTVRFMLDPERAQSEKTVVSEFFKVEMEEYEVEED